MRHAIAIDLGGTHASIGLLRENELLVAVELPLEAADGLIQLLPHLERSSKSLLQDAGLTSAECIGVALSLPSLVDFRAGKIASVNNKFPDAMRVDVGAWSREAFGLPLALENDARAALIGETVAGAGRGCNDVVMLTLGTGIGCAVRANGSIFRTMQPQGGNLGGHVPVRLDGRRCSCGALGCLESEASGWALPLVAKEMPEYSTSLLAREPKLDFARLFTAHDAGDSLASGILRHCIHVWSIGAVGLIHAYGPQRMIFGGGVMARAQDILPAIQQYVTEHAWTPAGAVEIVAAQLGNRAPLYAAIELIEEYVRGQVP